MLPTTFSTLHIEERIHQLGPIFFKTLDTYTQSLPGILQKLEELITNPDNKNLELEAHSLKGVSSNFYCYKLVELVQKLETIGQNNELPLKQTEALDILKLVRIESDKFVVELKDYVSKRT